MSNFGFSFVSISATTIAGGSVTTSLQIPGSFGGLHPIDPAAGRYLKSALVWVDSPTAGDQLTLLQVIDTDGVVPIPVRAALPNYPVVFDLIDVIGGVQSTILLPTSMPVEIQSFDGDGQPSMKFIPSQLYLKMTFLAGSLSAGAIVNCLIRWGLWQ